MAKPIEEADAALREFGKSYLNAFFKGHPTTQQSMDTVKDAVREQYEQEQDTARESLIEPPVIESPIRPRNTSRAANRWNRTSRSVGFYQNFRTVDNRASKKEEK